MGNRRKWEPERSCKRLIVGVKILLVLTLLTIFYQDIKDRAVWVFLFPLFALLGTYLFYEGTSWEHYKITVYINIGIIILIVLITYLLARFLFHKKLSSEALGLGDVLFFIGFALSFSTLTFINFFVFSILFTFVFWTILKNYAPKQHGTIPLAGCMSLFLLIIYTIYWCGIYHEIYII